MCKQCGSIFDSSGLAKTVADLKNQTEKADFWQDSKKAEGIMKSLNGKEKTFARLTAVVNDFDTTSGLLEESSDEEAGELESSVSNLETLVGEVKIMLYLSGKYDECNAVVMIHAGTGGTDAQDFSEMLLRMYLRFCEQQEWQSTILEQSYGEEAGIKSVTFEVTGPMAYGFLKADHGVHRLVRLSPFNSGNSRETSFAMVEVTPILEENLDVEIADDDLRVDVYRSGGKGGQSVNTTDSAVRLTHLPTGLVVQCQNERSQLQNKMQAMKVLVSKLVELKERQHVEKISDLRGGRQEIAWGNQIRSYVLQPYKMVKDHRTNVESTNPDKVFDGDLMPFIEGWLVNNKK
jgi:peptide chain release factor 2